MAREKVSGVELNFEREVKRCKYLNKRIKRLKQLLDHPEPARYTWQQEYGELMNQISEFWYNPKVADKEVQ